MGASVTFKKGFHPRTNIEKDEKGDFLKRLTLFWLGGGTTRIH